MNTHEPDHFEQLTKQELASRLRVSVRTLEYMVNRGELPPGKRIGREVFWVASVVTTWQAQAFAEQLNWQARAGAFQRRESSDGPAARASGQRRKHPVLE